MRLDIRFPIGLLFIVLGAILTIYGPLAGQQITMSTRWELT